MKKHIKLIGATLIVALLAVATVPRAQGRSDSQQQWTDQYRGDYEVPLGNYSGKSPFMGGRAKPAAKPASKAKRPPAPAPDRAPR